MLMATSTMTSIVEKYGTVPEPARSVHDSATKE